jgi:hypothetical protein
MATNGTPMIRPWIPPVASSHPVAAPVSETEIPAPRQVALDLLTAIPALRPAYPSGAASRAKGPEAAPHLGRYLDVVA